MTSSTALRQHWNRWGKQEGRSPSALYNPSYYSSRYNDIRQAFGNDFVAMYKHFRSHGISEQRQGSAEFNVSVYRQNYSDLQAAFGTNMLLYFKHYREYGMREKRNATSLLTPSTPAAPSTEQGAPAYVSTASMRLNIRTGPSSSASILTKLDRGTKVTLLSASSGWCKIRLSDGRVGYASSQYIKTEKSSNSGSALCPPVPAGCKFNKKTQDGASFYGYHDINRGVSIGTPVYAIADGTVSFRQATTSGYLTSYGNYIRFTSSDGVYTAVYAHLNSFEGVDLTIASSKTQKKSGSTQTYILATRTVKAGELLGCIGTTGNSSGPHLHFELYQNGKRIEPTSVISGLV